MTITQFSLILISLIAIAFGIAIIFLNSRKKLHSSVTKDTLTLEDKKAIERGELKVTPAKKMSWLYSFYVILFWLVKGWIDVKTNNCTLIFNLTGQLVTYFWWGIFVLPLLVDSFIDLYRNYSKAMQTGFLPKIQILNAQYQFYYKADLPQIRVNYLLKTLGWLLLVIGFSGLMINELNYTFKQVEMENYPKTQLSTYQLASKKLQQQCLAKKMK